MRFVELKRAQLKIQEMAFVLVAIVIFFALIALLFFSVKINSIKNQADIIQDEQAASLVRHISGLPEFSWSCVGCVDLDKVMALKKTGSIAALEMLELDYLKIEVLYPSSSQKICAIGNYPSCSEIVLLNKTRDYGLASSAFVNLCRWSSNAQQEICLLGKIYASGAGVKNE